jgi:hypothetical protein
VALLRVENPVLLETFKVGLLNLPGKTRFGRISIYVKIVAK